MSHKLDKFGTRMSQISAKYATQILAKYVTGATKKEVPFPIPPLLFSHAMNEAQIY
jgi:hypothetical protein